jgi:hypothetical protein
MTQFDPYNAVRGQLNGYALRNPLSYFLCVGWACVFAQVAEEIVRRTKVLKWIILIFVEVIFVILLFVHALTSVFPLRCENLVIRIAARVVIRVEPWKRPRKRAPATLLVCRLASQPITPCCQRPIVSINS